MELEDLSTGNLLNNEGLVLPLNYQEIDMLEFVYRGEAHKICKVNVKTWDSYVKKKLITPDGKDPLGHIYFRRDKVVRFSKRISKNRKPGLPLIR